MHVKLRIYFFNLYGVSGLIRVCIRSYEKVIRNGVLVIFAGSIVYCQEAIV